MKRTGIVASLFAAALSLGSCEWMIHLLSPRYMFTVTYAGNGNTGGIAPAAVQCASGSIVTVAGVGSLAKTGYAFHEWNTSADGASNERYAPGSTFTMPHEDVSLWAQWRAIEYALRYDGNGNTGGSVPGSGTQACDTTLTLAGAGSLVKAGYSLAGWNTAPDGSGNAFGAAAAFTMPAQDVTLYAHWTPGYPIVTLAGIGSTGYSGDGGPAVYARLYSPESVAADGAGNLYIADTLNHRVRKMDASGMITTVAGTGSSGYSGDGGAATSAQLQSPEGVAVDGAGNLYIADSANQRIRKVDPSGMISTVVGNGFNGYSGDDGPAISAQVFFPHGIAVDGGGDLYIADRSNQRVRKVDSSGTIHTVAGTGTYGYSGDGSPAISGQLNAPGGVAVDGAGNLYIADTLNHSIRKVDVSGTISTVAGTGSSGYSGDGGAATSAQLQSPEGVAVDGAGNLYIADSYNCRVRKVDPSGTISTVAGTGSLGFSGDGGPPASAELYYPLGVAVDGAGSLYIADTSNHRIRGVR